MRRFTRREWLISSGRYAAAAALAPALTSCGSIARGRSQVPGSVTVLYPGDEYTLGPDAAMPAQFLMFLPLVAWNMRGELEGRLAETWEHSPDYRDWTIRLRAGVRWHDGVPVTAHDIKFTLELMTSPTVGMPGYPSDSFAVKIIDPLTYTLHCNRSSGERAATGTPLDDYTVYYPAHLLERLHPKRFASWDFWTRPVGNGPYRHISTVPKTMMEFEANPEYFRGKPKISRVILKLSNVTGYGVLPELLSGNVDAATWVRRADLLALARDRRFAAHDEIGDEGNYFLLWNHRRSLFRDANIRRALTLAINRRELFDVLNLPADAPLLDAPFSGRQLRRRQFPVPIPFDPQQANQLFDAGGWRKNRKGLRERNGIPFRFTAITVNDEATMADAAIYIQAQLKRAGITMKLQMLEEGALWQRVITGEHEAAIYGMSNGAQNGVESRLAPVGYSNPRFQELADQLFRSVLPPEKQDELYRELGHLFHEDVPATFLYPQTLTTIAHRRIRGLDRSPYRGDLTWCMDELWLEEQA